MKFILNIILLFVVVTIDVQAQNKPNAVTMPAPTYQETMPANYPSGTKVNWTRVKTIRKPVTNPANITSLGIHEVIASTSFSDGLGRNIQNVSKAPAIGLKDIVSPVFYDSFGRRLVQLLPYASPDQNYGSFKRSTFTEQPAFYNSYYTDPHNPYSKSVIDETTLARQVLTMIPGSMHVGAGLGKMEFSRLNDVGEGVRNWVYTGSGLPTTTQGTADATLVVTETSDEANKRTRVYADKEGKTILTKVESSTTFAGVTHVGWNCTYYIYDDMNRLRLVLPPKLVDTLNSTLNWVLTQQLLDDLAYSYAYDYKGRVIESKLPGKSVVYSVYDVADRLVLVQDGNLRTTNDWILTKYDGLGRPILTGKFLNPSNYTRATLAQDMELAGSSSMAFVNFLKSPITSNTYNTGSVIADVEVYTLNYYDDYSQVSSGYSYQSSAYQALPSVTNEYLYNMSLETMTYPTISYSRVMNGTSTTSQWLSSASFYDAAGRIIQTHSTNYTGGKDTAHFKYDFEGKPLLSVTSTYNPAATDIKLVKTTSLSHYDNAGRLIRLSQKINNEPYYRIVKKLSYDNMNRVYTIALGNTAETQTYSYRIWGALESINKNFCLNGTGGNYFGCLLNYDYGFSQTDFRNMPSGMRWKLKGTNNIERAYGYRYDAAGRLSGADYTQKAAGTTTWISSAENYTADNMQYDVNGNLKHMEQWVTKIGLGAPFKMDNLNYYYKNGSNQLDKVNDAVTGNYGFDEFTEPSTNTVDYSYDANGNITQDKNRNITGIQYTYQNKPYLVTFNTGNQIRFRYDAGGGLVAKEITEGAQTKTINYIGGIQYENAKLQSIAQPEGRVRPVLTQGTGGSSWFYEYDYFVKDHQGNVRSVVTEEPDDNWNQPVILDGRISDLSTVNHDPTTGGTRTGFTVALRAYSVTSEIQQALMEESTFDNVSETRADNPESLDPDDQKAALLNAEEGSIIGPSIMLRVMAGDKINVSTQARYTLNGDQDYSNATVQEVAEALMTALSGGGAYRTVNESGLAPEFTYNAITQSQFLLAAQNLKNSITQNGEYPQAFLNYILLDDKLNVVDENCGLRQTTIPDQWNDLVVEQFELNRNGYLVVFLSNESKMNVFFNNLNVNHWKGKLMEENHYYPYGLTLTSKIYNNATNNNFLFSTNELNRKEFSNGTGLNWYNFDARQYDAQIGRWHAADPLAEQAYGWSPYNYAFSNPVVYTDANGLYPKPPDAAPIESPGFGIGVRRDASGRDVFGYASTSYMYASLSNFIATTDARMGPSYDWSSGSYMAGMTEVGIGYAASYYGARMVNLGKLMGMAAIDYALANAPSIADKYRLNDGGDVKPLEYNSDKFHSIENEEGTVLWDTRGPSFMPVHAATPGSKEQQELTWQLAKASLFVYLNSNGIQGRMIERADQVGWNASGAVQMLAALGLQQKKSLNEDLANTPNPFWLGQNVREGKPVTPIGIFAGKIDAIYSWGSGGRDLQYDVTHPVSTYQAYQRSFNYLWGKAESQFWRNINAINNWRPPVRR